MKKLFALLAVAFGVMSCQTDPEGFGANVGGEQDVNITVSLPEATRGSENGALENGVLNSHDLRYILEITYNEEVYRDVEISNATSATFPVRLAPGREYKIAVWADFVEKGTTADDADLYYETSAGLANISIIDGAPMTEARDAYCGRYTLTSDKSVASIPTITLTRPFAKVRVVTTDVEDLAKIGVALPTSATIKYATDVDIYNKFNAFTGVVASENAVNEHTFNYANTYAVENGEMTLFADYLFVPQNGSITHFTLNVTDHVNKSFTTDIPVVANKLTTIKGDILTNGSDIKVEIEDSFANADNIEDEPYYIEIWDGESQTQPEITVDQTTGEQVAVIGQASELAWLAAFVNGTLTEGASTFATRAGEVEPVKFVLGADIDLGGFPWTPIGYNPNDEAGNENCFTGVFDGQNHKIYNLYIDVKDKGGVGFFGAVNNATIKNITFENVFVKAVESEEDPKNSSGAEGKTNYIVGGHIGAVVGYDAAPWGTGEVNFENVHVTGLVQIEGETRAAQGQRIGGIIGGRGYSKMSFKNVSVNGAEGSYIKGYCSTAGVSGQIQGVTTYENVTTDIDVYAVTFGAGGIAGIVTHGSTFTNCSTKGNVTLDASKTQLSSYSANYPFRVGGIAGCWSDSKTGVLTLTNCSYEGTLTSIDRDGNSPENFDYAGFVGRGYSLKNCAGSKVIVNGDEYVQAYETTYGVYYVNGNYEVNTAADLKALANDVNTGKDYFEGKTVVLTADIDLNGEEWTPIGSAYMDHGFMGNFDGKGFAIKNLAIKNIALDSDDYAYAGLFGVTEGVDQDNQNYIKNLVIENVNIDTNGHIVAAAIAYPYYTVVENVTVKGDVAIEGGDYTSGVLAYTRRCVDAKDIAIAANEGSYIKGNKTIGGVISDIQMNGGLTANYSNFAASGLTIEGVNCVGGISGIISKQTLNGATVKNVTIVCDDVRKGQISGSVGDPSVLNSVVVENVEGAENLVGATYDSGKTSKVTIDGVVYEYLANGQIKVNGAIVVSTSEALDAAIKAGETTILLKEGVYVIPNSAQKKTLVIKGLGQAANTKIATNNTTGSYEGCNYALDGSTVTFENISINTPSTTYIGYARCKATYNGCLFNGTYTLYDNSTFEKCVFNVSGDVYNVWTWGAPVATFTDCTFNSDGKAMLLYGQANTKLTINDCVFNDNGGLTDLKAAIEIGNDYNSSYELIVNNTVVNGYEINDKGINTGTTLWANKNSMGQDKLNVVVDGVDVY